MRYNQKRTFVQRLAVSYILMTGLVLILSFTMFYETLSARNIVLIDKIIRTYAAQLSYTEYVHDAFDDGKVSDELMSYLDQVISSEDYIDYIVLADTDSIRLYHPDHTLIGEHFQGGDEGPAIKGESGYITEGEGSQEFQRRCFESISDENGRVIGFIMVSCNLKAIALLQNTDLFRVLMILIAALLIAVAAAYIVADRIKKRLLGYEPAHIAELFQQREDVLNSMSEGLILVDNDWKCEYMNEPAEELLSAGGTYTDDQLREMVSTDIRFVSSGETTEQVQMNRNDRTLLIDVSPIYHNKKQIGKLVLLNDMTRLQRMAEDLTGVKHIIEALRATSHEQKNRLHVILGLLQLSETEEAMRYISNTVDYEENNSRILNSIENKTIAALILGKMNRAHELNIHLQLVKGSFLEAHNDYLPAKDLVTIIGNLIENSFDALEGVDRDKNIDLYINSSPEGMLIAVDDNGKGMTEETREKILTEAYTTKGEGRGTGMRLIRNIVNRCHGTLGIDSEPGEGSSFTIVIKEKRIRTHKD